MNLKTLLPNASKDCIALNTAPLKLRSAGPGNSVQGNVERVRPNSVRRGKMNKVEAEFAMILEAQKRKGEILRWEFEGITLRFAGVKYTPDFVVFEQTDSTYRDGHEFIARFKFLEIKGPFIKGNRERAVERFRHARTYWPEFTFELWQKSKKGWKQIL